VFRSKEGSDGDNSRDGCWSIDCFVSFGLLIIAGEEEGEEEKALLGLCALADHFSLCVSTLVHTYIHINIYKYIHTYIHIGSSKFMKQE
jgi:hypothetical protein